MKEIKPENLKAGSNLEKVLASGQFACTGKLVQLHMHPSQTLINMLEEMRGKLILLTLQITRQLLSVFPVGQHHYAYYSWVWNQICRWCAVTGTV